MGAIRCQHCEAEFTPKTTRRRFCSDQCRAAAWTASREADLALVHEALRRAMARVERMQRAKS